MAKSHPFKRLWKRLKTNTKSSKLWLLSSRRFSRPTALALAATLALIGIVAVARSIAGGSLATPTGANELVLEYHTPHAHASSADKLAEYQPHSKLLLYGDGRLICGSDDTPTATKHTTAQLPPAQVANVVARLNAAGLRQLTDTYNQDPYELPALETGITLNLASGAKKVAHYSGPKPPAFDRSIQILEQACAQATQPYQPDTVRVEVLKQAGPPAATPKAPAVLAPAFDVLPPKLASRQVSGQTAQSILDNFAGRSKAVITENGATYEAAIYPQLPEYREPKLKSSRRKANTAQAAGQSPIQYYWFYPSNHGRHPKANETHRIAAGISDFYNRDVGKQVTLNPVGEIRGNYADNWYKTCRRAGGCDSLGGDWHQTLAAYDNLYKLYYQAGRSTNMLVQFSTYPGGSCPGIGGPTGSNGGFAMTTNVAGSACGGDWAYKIAAHEQGHSMGLARTPSLHRTDCSIMNSPPCGGTLHQQYVNGDDANHLRGGPFFNPAPSIIEQKHRSLGGDGGILGRPVSGEFSTACRGARYRSYERGTIYWRGDVGAHFTMGAIHQKYGQLYYECGFLDLPVTDELGTPNGKGRYSKFIGGSIYWSPATGAHAVNGAIKNKWGEKGYENGFLGFPTTSEAPTACAGGRYNNFQGGTITWTARTGAKVLNGPIQTKWAELGSSCGFLGFPTSDVYAITAGTKQNFENGSITRSSLTGAISVTRSYGTNAPAAGTYQLVAKHSGKCADVVPNSNNGANIHQWACHTGDNQRFDLKTVAGSYYKYKLVAKHSGKCVDVNPRLDDGAGIYQWACHAGANQTFALQDVGGGYYRIVAKHSGKCADVAPNSNDGANIYQWTCRSGDNQRFLFRSVAAAPAPPPPAAPPPPPAAPPPPPPGNGAVPVCQYYSSSATNHFYNTSCADYSAAGYAKQGAPFNAYTTQVSGTVPVCSYYNQPATSHAYTKGCADAYGDYKKQGVAFYAYATQVADSVGVCGYYNSTEKDYFYTPGCAASYGNYQKQGTGPWWYAR
ncbi:RICIN domain-containing protein [Candidatus Parcubacteria bacterium]|nr:RICIN domain-containing protein [Candidatus Parcubacteria bacterium]